MSSLSTFLLQVLSQIAAQLSPARYGINFLDIIIVVVIFFYAKEGYSLGFTLAALDLFSFIVSFTIALKFYAFFAHILTVYFSLPIGFANAAGFFLTAFFCEVFFNMLLRRLLDYVPVLNTRNVVYKAFQKADHLLGILPGIISAFIILSFLLSVIVALPSSPLIKRLVTGSQIGSKLIANTSLFESKLNDIFGGALNETMNFLTVEPKSTELVTLHFKVTDGSVNTDAEQAMFVLVNKEREKNGLPDLVWDMKLTEVGRAHSKDMFERGYFSHYTPEGLSPFDRMTAAGISFTYAGENLALAPSTDLAMQGLMNSPGHRANILSPNFHKIGIGAIDGGVYGLMFSQEFTN